MPPPKKKAATKPAKKAAKKSTKKNAKAGGPGFGPGSANSIIVPIESVGPACQAAVSLEEASMVTARATDATRMTFEVTWS